MPAITTLPNQLATRNSVTRTMPQKPNSGRPTADAKSSTFHAIQKTRGPSRSAAASARSATATPPATSAPNPTIRSTMRRTGLTGRVYDGGDDLSLGRSRTGRAQARGLSDLFANERDAGEEQPEQCRRPAEKGEEGAQDEEP